MRNKVNGSPLNHARNSNLEDKKNPSGEGLERGRMFPCAYLVNSG